MNELEEITRLIQNTDISKMSFKDQVAIVQYYSEFIDKVKPIYLKYAACETDDFLDTNIGPFLFKW